MGCARCGRRQVDPSSGPSTWRRAVVAGEQVLVCPECQTDGWTDGLDRCGACGSPVLVTRLGDVVCRACGHEAPAVRAAVGAVPAGREALARDVAEALDRILRRE
jgi:DNA-directed RNA polymerase subunit RPC12/RpoP